MPRRESGSPWIVGLAIVLTCVGCGSPSEPKGQKQGPEQGGPLEPLRIAAASDLQTVLPVLAKRFTDRTKVELTLTFGSSGLLAEQIKAGAPFDVYLAANQAFVQKLAAGGLVQPDSVHPYARGTLVLAVHRESGGAIASLADLEKPEIKKIALANPETAPYGTAGKQALERSGLWSKLEPKIVPAESVRQALQFVESGNAEGGLVGRALANLPKVRIVEIEPKLYDPIIQALGVLSRTKRAKDAGAFADFVLSDEGQSILNDAGFAHAPAPSE
ncbi:molybdate transport system substrate-binding protein [Singulisphaera sp. GP187]|uniref:molybdate ABC transporter substrate-binding protein n=1 Tax=Singulisphaera sp. GP187 TaxID=1882752 RepID=UPI00092B3D82|nr:molybdate ABC transporter substrate-binding protein [Singulisphaera sp. GP187]SIO66540.1 molybdate transport system substrate-binding protein [Singulisphaera sp. GP187]